MLNNNLIGALIAILVSILFAFKLNDNSNKKEGYAGGMPQRKLVVDKVSAFVPNKDCNNPDKVQFYSVSNFQSNPSQRGTNPNIGPLLRTQLSNPARLSNDIRLKFDSSCKTMTSVEDFAGMVEEGFDSNCKVDSSYASLPVVQPDYAAGNFNSQERKDVILSDMMPVGDMRAAVDDEGNPGNIVNFQSMMYANIKDCRNNKDGDFIRGDLAIPQNKGTCWFGQRGYSLRPSALSIIGGDDLSNHKNLEKMDHRPSAYTRMQSSHLSAASGDLVVENQSGGYTSSFF